MGLFNCFLTSYGAINAENNWKINDENKLLLKPKTHTALMSSVLNQWHLVACISFCKHLKQEIDLICDRATHLHLQRL